MPTDLALWNKIREQNSKIIGSHKRKPIWEISVEQMKSKNNQYQDYVFISISEKSLKGSFLQ